MSPRICFLRSLSTWTPLEDKVSTCIAVRLPRFTSSCSLTQAYLNEEFEWAVAGTCAFLKTSNLSNLERAYDTCSNTPLPSALHWNRHVVPALFGCSGHHPGLFLHPQGCLDVLPRLPWAHPLPEWFGLDVRTGLEALLPAPLFCTKNQPMILIRNVKIRVNPENNTHEIWEQHFDHFCLWVACSKCWCLSFSIFSSVCLLLFVQLRGGRKRTRFANVM